MRAFVAALIGVMLAAGSATAQALPAALNQPALVSPRAAHALLLGVTTAGQRLVAVGEHGIVLLSDDDGAHWRQASMVPVSVTLTAVRFASASSGWAVGHLGVILHSDDGGETWQRQLDGVQAAALMRAGAVGPTALANADQLVADGPDKPFLDISVVGGKQVLAVGANGLAVRSADGGRSWTAAELPDPQSLHLYGLARFGSTSLVAGEQGFLAMAENDGPFQPIRTPHGGSFFGVTVLPGGTALAYGLGGVVVRTGDMVAGAPWFIVDCGLSGSITRAVALPDGRVLLGSDSGELAIGDAAATNFRLVHLDPRIPVTDMLVDGANLILTGPSGPRLIPLHTLEAAS
jgi:photosystem II stability/assembly factor-like uncharacterized protein